MFQIWIATAKLRQINNQVARQFQVTRKTGPGTVIISGQSHQIMRAKSKVQLNNTPLQIASPFARVQTVLSVFDILHRKIIYWGNNIKSPGVTFLMVKCDTIFSACWAQWMPSLPNKMLSPRQFVRRIYKYASYMLHVLTLFPSSADIPQTQISWIDQKASNSSEIVYGSVKIARNNCLKLVYMNKPG